MRDQVLHVLNALEDSGQTVTRSSNSSSKNLVGLFEFSTPQTILPHILIIASHTSKFQLSNGEKTKKTMDKRGFEPRTFHMLSTFLKVVRSENHTPRPFLITC